MPGAGLIHHQWRKHGACSGLEAEAYFAATETARKRLSLPSALTSPARPRRLSVEELEATLAEANPGLSGEMVAVVCRRGSLREVRVCLEKDLDFRPCGQKVEDRCPGEALLPAAR